MSRNLTLLSGAKLYFFQPGTTTARDTYANSSLTTPHANPVVADSAGVFPAIYVNPSLEYKAVLKTSDDALLREWDKANNQAGYQLFQLPDQIALSSAISLLNNDTVLSQSVIGSLLFARTTDEQDASVNPTDTAVNDVDVVRYGADETGVLASNTAFTTALAVVKDQGANHTEASRIGGRIKLPAGVFKLTSTITIGKDQVLIEGDANGGTVVHTTGAFPAFTVDNSTLQKSYGVVFRNIRFTSTVTDRAAGSAAIKFVAAENFTVENCLFHLQTKYGVWMVDCITGRILNNQFDSGDWQNQGMDYAIYGESSNDASVASGTNATVVALNTIRYTVTAGLALKGQPISDSPTTLRRECSGVQVFGNHFEHNYGDSIQLLRNRSWFIVGNWFEDGGLDAASGHAYINDIATDDNEASGGGANSGLNAAISIRANTFGGHDNAHANFEHVSLSFTVNAIIDGNYLTSGIIGVTADCRGLVVRNNWSSQDEPTLAGALPASRVIHDNFNGPTASATNAVRWTGDFETFDGGDTPVAITATSDTTPSIIDSTVGKVRKFVLAATGALTITQFDDAQHGDVLHLIWANGNTTLQNTTGNSGINLAGQANFTGATKDTMTLMYVDGGSSGFTARWFEISRRICTPQTYTATNVTTDRAFDADTVAVAELADVVGTLIADLRAAGIVK